MPERKWDYKSSFREKELMKENPQDAQTSVALAYVAGGTSGLLFPLNYHHNNGDAFRHCFWSSIIAKEVSPEWAHTWVMAHEMDDPPENIDRLMDEYNNNQGINIFKNNPNASAGELIYLCLKAIGKGKLKEIKNEKNVSATQLESFIIKFRCSWLEFISMTRDN